jgi:hypothetical protein
VVAAGLSATAVLGITAALGLAHAADGTTPAPVAPAGATPAALPGPTAPGGTGRLVVPRATPSFTAPAPVPDATTHGSR